MNSRDCIASIIISSTIIVGLSANAFGQSSPGLYTGEVPTAAQWNSYFALKQDFLGYTPVNKAGDSMTGTLVTALPTSASAGFNLPPGTAPTDPKNGDVWTTNAGLFLHVNGATTGPLAPADSGSFSATAPISVSFPENVVTYALNIDHNFAITSGALAFSAVPSADLLANCTGASAEPTLCTWNSYANLAIGDTSGIVPYNSGGTWSSVEIAGTGLAVSNGSLNLQPAQSSTIGGVESIAPVSHNWIAYIDSFGIPHLSQPSAADLSNGTTGSGTVVLSNSPALITPNLGVATATTLNGLSIGATTGALNVADGKTLTDTSSEDGSLLMGQSGGGFSAYGGSSCTDQAMTAVSGSGAATCASITNDYLSAGTFSNITGVGTLTVGTWNASPIGSAFGGSGVASPAAHSLIQSEGSSPFSVVPATTVGNIVIDQGAGLDWASKPVSGDATLAASGAITVTKTNGVAFTALATTEPGAGVATALGDAVNTSGGILSYPLDLDSSAVGTSILQPANGGSGVASPTAHGVLIAEGANAYNSVTTSTGGLCLLSKSGSDPVWSSCGGSMAVSSVSNTDGTLTISPTAGNVVASIADSVALPGNPTATTQSAKDNSTRLATTAYVDAATSTTGTILTVAASTLYTASTAGFLEVTANGGSLGYCNVNGTRLSGFDADNSWGFCATLVPRGATYEAEMLGGTMRTAYFVPFGD